jgi:DNA polymerase (family 10)
MARANDHAEQVLLEFADLLSILSDDPFKPRAYEKAARAVGGYHADVSGLDVKGIIEIPSVGKSIAEKIHELLQTGTFAELEQLRAKIPPGVRDVMAIPGLGPKKAMALYQDLGVSSVEELVAAIEGDKLTGLKGFGPKTQDNILRGVQQLSASGGRILVSVALDLAEALLDALASLPQARAVAYAGSLRRMRETIGDVDLLVASTQPAPIMDAFVALPSVTRVLAHGDTKSSIITEGGPQVDLRVVRPEVWGAAMIYFTGSKAHNVRIREMAVRAGLKLNEYGLFDAKSGELLAARTEEKVYQRLGLPYIPPTLREDRGEVEAALSGDLPRVIQQKDLGGDLHTHTNLTDGLASLEEMLDTADAYGYAYYAVTDHAPNLAMQRMTTEKIVAQRARLERLRADHAMTLLHGTELNIDPDGDVDWPDAVLAGFDLTIASIHSHFTQPRAEITRRMIRAMENPYVNVIGHPTARSIGKRPPIDLDLDAVFETAARTGTALEINSFPDRLDLNDEHILRARRYGVKFAVNTDAHAPLHLPLIRYGVATAQRGWLTKEDVINAWPLARLRRFLQKGRKT